MMTNSKKWLTQWLRDAHAMEEQAETMLQSQIDRLESYPELRDRLSLHLDETRKQGQRLEQCLEKIGEGTSTLKDAGDKLVATAQGLSGIFAGDEVMKGTLAGYTFEHMEIASYKMLIAAAEEAGESDIQRICKENLREEEAMAAWLESNLRVVTARFLRRDELGSDSAKR
jgi:ferritin-like metal-binding protein YciE